MRAVVRFVDRSLLDSASRRAPSRTAEGLPACHELLLTSYRADPVPVWRLPALGSGALCVSPGGAAVRSARWNRGELTSSNDRRSSPPRVLKYLSGIL